MPSRLLTLLAVAACLGVTAAEAADLRVAAPAATRPAPTVDAADCGDEATLAKIVERFAWAEANTWHRGYVIERIEAPRLRYRNEDGPSMIRHRHCEARAVMTDGSARPVFYTVEERMGLASIGRGVTFCVLGLDPWHIYDSACRTLR